MVATLRRAAKTVHKDQTKAPPRTVTPADNGPSDDVILVFAGKLEECDLDIKALRDRRKKIVQEANNAGVVEAEMKDASKFVSMGIDAALAKFKRFVRYWRVLGGMREEQLTLFAEPNSKTLSHEEELKKAFDWGRTLGLMGKFPDTQMYQPETPLGQEQIRGWNEGQKVLHEQLMRNSEEEAARKKKAEEDEAAKAAAKAAKKTRKGRFKPTVVSKEGEDAAEEKTADDEAV